MSTLNNDGLFTIHKALSINQSPGSISMFPRQQARQTTFTSSTDQFVRSVCQKWCTSKDVGGYNVAMIINNIIWWRPSLILCSQEYYNAAQVGLLLRLSAAFLSTLVSFLAHQNTQEVKNERPLHAKKTKHRANFWHTLPSTKGQTDRHISNTKKIMKHLSHCHCWRSQLKCFLPREDRVWKNGTCFISVCPSVALFKATYAEHSRIVLSCWHKKAFIFNLFCVYVLICFLNASSDLCFRICFLARFLLAWKSGCFARRKWAATIDRPQLQFLSLVYIRIDFGLSSEPLQHFSDWQ